MSPELQLADTSNQFLVATSRDGERVCAMPWGGVVSRAEALNMAAWIVALTDPEQKEFQPLLKAVREA